MAKLDIFKNPMYLIIGLLLVIIIILLINNYYVNSKRKNVMERFYSATCSTDNGYGESEGKCICLKDKDSTDVFTSSIKDCDDFTKLTQCQKESCAGMSFTASANNCKIIDNLPLDNKKSCCNDFLDSIESKSLCMTKETCIDFTKLTPDQKELCKDKNFTASDNNCKVRDDLNRDNQRECCYKNFKSVQNKSDCIDFDVNKFCTNENKNTGDKYFNGECCRKLKSEDNFNLKSEFCKLDGQRFP